LKSFSARMYECVFACVLLIVVHWQAKFDLMEANERFTVAEVQWAEKFHALEVEMAAVRLQSERVEVKRMKAERVRDEAIRELADAVTLARACEEQSAHIAVESEFVRLTSMQVPMKRFLKLVPLVAPVYCDSGCA
jgi:hypothetical protein